MKLTFLLVTTSAVMVAPALVAEPPHYITVPLSFKLIRSPVDGSLPSGTTQAQWDSDLQATMNDINVFMARYQRGYRYVLFEPSVPIGSQGDWSGPSQFYDRTHNSGNEINSTAYANQLLYKWRTNAVNIYVRHANENAYTGMSGTPSDAYQTPFHPRDANNLLPFGYAVHVLHETGHFFMLNHTFGNSSDCTFGDDGIADTLPDADSDNCSSYTTLDDVALHFYGQSYSALLTNSPANVSNVDNVFYNIMSYHADENLDTNRYALARFTEGQLEPWVQSANMVRPYIVSHKTWFVDSNGTNGPNNGTNGLRFTLPLRTVAYGVQYANPLWGDMVLLRAGHYNEQLRITKRAAKDHQTAQPATASHECLGLDREAMNSLHTSK